MTQYIKISTPGSEELFKRFQILAEFVRGQSGIVQNEMEIEADDLRIFTENMLNVGTQLNQLRADVLEFLASCPREVTSR